MGFIQEEEKNRRFDRWQSTRALNPYGADEDHEKTAADQRSMT
jgi:hypothetical protein